MRYVIYEYIKKMATAGSESQLLPLGKFHVCFRLFLQIIFKVMRTKSLLIRLSNVVQKDENEIKCSTVLKACCLCNARATKKSEEIHVAVHHALYMSD